MSHEGSNRPLIVQKFGGMSLASPEHIKNAARRVAKLYTDGFRVIAVVSAMGKSTDDLVKLAYSVSPSPNRRELDMLLSTGERISMSLFSMALTDALKAAGLTAKSVSFTGSQAGILTDDTHSNARIIDVRAGRVQEELDRGNIPILAGFQGVSPVTKEITTLGRGGTDVTAVALAIAFKAERCEILKEVDGVLTADPRIVPTARLIPKAELAELAEMTFWGAKVLHYRSVELALTHKLPLRISLAHPTQTQLDRHTEVLATQPTEGGKKMSAQYENETVLAISSHLDVRRVLIRASGIAEALEALSSHLRSHRLPPPQVLDVKPHGDEHWALLLTAPTETLEAQVKTLSAEAHIFECRSERLSTVTATCRGSVASDMPSRLSSELASAGIQAEQLMLSGLSVTFVTRQVHYEAAIKTLHTLIK